MSVEPVGHGSDVRDASRREASFLNRLVAFVLVAGTAAYFYRATGLSFGSLANPKAGFLPQVAGAAGLVLASINLISVYRSAATPGEGSLSVLATLPFLLGLVGYLVALAYVGFLPATAIGLFYLLLVGGTGWKASLMIAGGTAAVLYGALVHLLKLPLP